MPIGAPVQSTEQMEAARYLQTVLGGDSQLLSAAPSGVWFHPAPRQVSGIWVSYQLQTGVDAKTATRAQVWTDMTWLVRAWGETRDFEDLGPAAARIQQLLDPQPQPPIPASTGRALVYSSSRESAWMQRETDYNREFASLGGLYRLYVQLGT